jgi:hypothetical protein
MKKDHDTKNPVGYQNPNYEPFFESEKYETINKVNDIENEFTKFAKTRNESKKKTIEESRSTNPSIKKLKTETTSKLRETLGLKSVILTQLKNSLKSIEKINHKHNNERKESFFSKLLKKLINKKNTQEKSQASLEYKESKAVGTLYKEIKNTKNKAIDIDFVKLKKETQDLMEKLKNELKSRKENNSLSIKNKGAGWKKQPTTQLTNDIKKLNEQLSRIKKIEKSVDIHNMKVQSKADQKEIKNMIKKQQMSFVPGDYQFQKNDIKTIKKAEILNSEKMKKEAKSALRMEKLNEMIDDSKKSKVENAKNSVLKMIQNTIENNISNQLVDLNQESNDINIKDTKSIFNYVKNEILSQGKSKDSLDKLKALESIEKDVHKAGVGVGNSRSL